MAINQDWNKRIDITLPKKQYEWIESQAKRLNISKSKFISYIIGKRINEIVDELKIYIEEDHNKRMEALEEQITIQDEIDYLDEARQKYLLEHEEEIKKIFNRHL